MVSGSEDNYTKSMPTFLSLSCKKIARRIGLIQSVFTQCRFCCLCNNAYNAFLVARDEDQISKTKTKFCIIFYSINVNAIIPFSALITKLSIRFSIKKKR